MKQGASLTNAWEGGASGRGSSSSRSAVEYSYALHYRITFGLVQNKAGQFVQPSADSFQAAADRADWGNAQDFYLVMTDADGECSYSVTATTFILMYKKPKDVQRTKAALDFFKWALEEGQGQAQELDYVPLPLSLVCRIQLYWKGERQHGYVINAPPGAPAQSQSYSAAFQSSFQETTRCRV